MDDTRTLDLGAAILDDHFPEVDLALRRGRHIDRDDGAWYALLTDAQLALETFYRRYGCELVHKSDGYFYLLPTTDQLGKRQLSVPEMLVGQALALLYLDPKTVQSGGVVTRDEVLAHMAAVMGTDGLMQAFNPKKRRLDERVAQETVRQKVADALRKLDLGGFIEVVDSDHVRLRAALMRFAEPVRGSDAPAEALAKLVARGEVMLEPEFGPDEDEAPPSSPPNLADAARALAGLGKPADTPQVDDDDATDVFDEADEGDAGASDAVSGAPSLAAAAQALAAPRPSTPEHSLDIDYDAGADLFDDDLDGEESPPTGGSHE